MGRIAITTVAAWALLALLLAWAPVGAAALAPDAVHEARQELRSYDVEGRGTTDVIARLGAVADGAPAPVHRREARYLRAVAATDLLVVAERTADAALRVRVAEALGAPEARLEAWLRAELATLCFGAYGPTAQDAREGLAILEALRAGRDPDFDRDGLRRDALYVAAVRVAAREGRLAEMAEDPCPGDGDCPSPERLFVDEGRRAIEALRRAGAALARLEEAAELGDPLALALRDRVTEDRIALETMEIHPAPRLEGASFRGLSAEVPSAAPDAVLVVGAEAVRWAWVPRVRLGDAREPVAVAPAGPVLPAFERIDVPSDLRPALLPIEGVHRALERLRASSPSAVVAIVAETDAPGHVLARVLLSLHRLGIDRPLLAGVGADGALRGVPLRIASAREPGRERAHLRVRVRLGGYSLHSPAGFQDIPRVRDADERLRFDVATLAAGARRVPGEAAEVSFMSAVRSGPLLAAAFTVAPAGGPVTLVLP